MRTTVTFDKFEGKLEDMYDAAIRINGVHVGDISRAIEDISGSLHAHIYRVKGYTVDLEDTELHLKTFATLGGARAAVRAHFNGKK